MGTSLDVQGLAGVLVAAGEALEHVDLVLVHRDGEVGLGELQLQRSLRRGCRRRGWRRGSAARVAPGWCRRVGPGYRRVTAGARGQCVASGAGSTSSTSTPPASLGWTKLTRESDGAALRGVVQQAQAALAEDRRDGLDVGDPEGELLEAGARALEELRDGRALRQRGQQLDAGAGVADGDHRLAHPLLLVGLLVHHGHAVGVAVEGHRHVEVGHGDADVVDRREQVFGNAQGRRGHGSIVTDRPRPGDCL